MAYHLYYMVPRESGGLDLNPGSATSKLVTVGKLLNLSVLICQMEILLHRPPGLLPRAKSIHIEQSAGHTEEPTQTSVLSSEFSPRTCSFYRSLRQTQMRIILSSSLFTFPTSWPVLSTRPSISMNQCLNFHCHHPSSGCHSCL